MAVGVVDPDPVEAQPHKRNFTAAAVCPIAAEFETIDPLQSRPLPRPTQTEAAQCNGIVETLYLQIPAYLAADFQNFLMCGAAGMPDPGDAPEQE